MCGRFLCDTSQDQHERSKNLLVPSRPIGRPQKRVRFSVSEMMLLFYLRWVLMLAPIHAFTLFFFCTFSLFQNCHKVCHKLRYRFESA
jgi:hypothetical protein